MHRLRRHPLFFAQVAIILVAIGAEAWFVFNLRRQERVLEVQLIQKIGEIERLQRQRPGPTDENLRRAHEDFAQHAKVLATMLGSLRVSRPEEIDQFKDEPADRNELYFDIIGFIEAMRGSASQAGVLVRPGECFGFAAYVNEGPEPELIRPVFRQFRVVEELLKVLIPAQPRTIEGVQREDPRTIVRNESTTDAGSPTAAGVTSSARAAPAPTRGGAAPVDVSASEIFTIDPQVSARTPGYVDTMAFRIAFTGQTSCLRAFMNALAVPAIPLVVRSVEVEPLRAERPPVASRAGTARADQPSVAPDQAIVADNESRFIVTVELFEVKLRAPEIPEATAAP